MTVIFENVNGIAAIAVGIGLMTVAGQAFGAGRKEEAKYYIIKLTGYAEIVLIISCAVTFLISRPIMHLAGMEAESMELCYQMLIAITIAKPILWALSFIPPYGLRAAGDVKFSMITATCTMWFCRVALAVYLIRFQGFGTDRSVDRYVCRLGNPKHYLLHSFHIRQMDGKTCDLNNTKVFRKINVFLKTFFCYNVIGFFHKFKENGRD